MADEPSRQVAGFAGKTLDEFLKDRKYHALPIDRSEPLRLKVRGQAGQHPVLFLLDTACDYPISLSRRAVANLKLPTRMDENKKVATPYKEGVGETYARVESLAIGDAVTMTKGEVRVNDISDQPQLAGAKGRVYEGIIGHPLLAGAGAIIDVLNAKVYYPGTCRIIDLPNAKTYISTAAGSRAAVADELAAYFKAERYVEVPSGGRRLPYLKCKIGGHDLTLIVDTGAPNTMLDRTVAARIGVKTRPLSPPDDHTVIGPLPGPLKLPEGLEIPAPNDVLVYDFSTLNRGLEKQGLSRMDGLLGVNVLQYFSAVIDYSRPEPRLFLIDPTVQDAKLQDGEWVGEAAEIAGKPVPGDEVKDFRLVVWKDRFDLRLGAGRRLDLNVDLMCPDPNLKWFDLSLTGPAGKLTYPAIYEVSRERFRVCLPLEVKPGEKVERPKEFKSKPGSPYAVLTFRRAKPK
jgi:uncharacterized protein (TIGR03067 family)